MNVVQFRQLLYILNHHGFCRYEDRCKECVVGLEKKGTGCYPFKSLETAHSIYNKLSEEDKLEILIEDLK